MKKYIFLFLTFLLMALGTSFAIAAATPAEVSAGTAVSAPAHSASKMGSCDITCYEKTPECYVTKDKSGCLDISNEKPVCAKGKCSCSLHSCKIKTMYKAHGGTSTTTTTDGKTNTVNH